MTFDYDFKMRIGASRSVVFERLLRIEHLSRWFCGWCRIDPKVGGAFKFGGETCIILPEQRSWDTTIDEGEVLRRFAFTWPIRASKTRVSYELEDRDTGKALLRVRHRGVPFEDSTCGTVPFRRPDADAHSITRCQWNESIASLKRASAPSPKMISCA